MNHKIDFDDMLELCYYTLKEREDVRLSWQKRYKYILIDEFQDINKAQYECVKLLSGEEKNVFAVGDDDQSIYGFRGARPEFLLKFPTDFKDSQKIVLDINYRSSDNIIKISNAIICHNKKRYEKTIHGTDKQGPTPKLIRPEDINSEAKEIAERIKKLSERVQLNNIAVIYRTNIQARALVDTFMDYHINYRLRDEIPSIYRHWCAKDILAYLSLGLNRCDNDSIERIINKPKRYISKVTIAESKKACRENESLIESIFRQKDLKAYQYDRLHDLIFQLSRIKEKNTYDAIKYIMKVIGYNDYLKEYSTYRKLDYKSLLEIVNEISEAAKDYPNISDFLSHIKTVEEEIKEKQSSSMSNNTDGVVLTPMHSAKGLEFDTVFITSVIEGIIPHEKSTTDDEKEEERRLFYVAVTRAKRLLYFSSIKTRYDKETKLSPFLKDFIK
ncbi:MAG: ATP-dependent helicase [Firmicutes bacterium]|nr:ATP-dependent helicase [Bacillota bacterium]